MHLSKLIFSICAPLVITVLAAPSPDSRYGDHQGDCLTQKDAKYLVNTLQYFYVKLDKPLAKKTLTVDFIAQSDSQNALFGNLEGDFAHGEPQGAHNRTDFIGTQLTQQAETPVGAPNTFVTLNLWYGCNHIAFRWYNFFETEIPSQGIDVLEVVKEDGKWKITTDYSEWDVLALAYGVGARLVWPEGQA